MQNCHEKNKNSCNNLHKDLKGRKTKFPLNCCFSCLFFLQHLLCTIRKCRIRYRLSLVHSPKEIPMNDKGVFLKLIFSENF